MEKLSCAIGGPGGYLHDGGWVMEYLASNTVRLSLMELSALKEIANVGLGHATTALSDMTGRSFNMEVPSVGSVPLETVPEIIGGAEQVTLGVYMPFCGEVEGHIAFLFPWVGAQKLMEMLLGASPADPGAIDELSASAMLEVGNIINSSFLNAIADMTNLEMVSTPPLVSIDSCYAIVSTVVAEAEMKEVAALAIETRLFCADAEGMTGLFVCIPSVDGLKLMFERLGLIEGAA